jgi:hypothetical protein
MSRDGLSLNSVQVRTKALSVMLRAFAGESWNLRLVVHAYTVRLSHSGIHTRPVVVVWPQPHGMPAPLVFAS